MTRKIHKKASYRPRWAVTESGQSVSAASVFPVRENGLETGKSDLDLGVQCSEEVSRVSRSAVGEWVSR